MKFSLEKGKELYGSIANAFGPRYETSGYMRATIKKIISGGRETSDRIGMEIPSGEMYVYVLLSDGQDKKKWGPDAYGSVPASKMKGLAKGDSVRVMVERVESHIDILDLKK
jgi:hypothetical protein